MNLFPRAIQTITITVGVMLVLTGCANGPGVYPDGWPDGLIDRSRTSSDAPAEFKDREPLASCGDLELGQGEPIPKAAFDCLNDAHDTGAELVVAMPTTEGDPIVTYYRVGPDIIGMDVFTDATLDAYGGTWYVQHCRGTIDASLPAGC